MAVAAGVTLQGSAARLAHADGVDHDQPDSRPVADASFGPAVWMRIPRVGIDSHVSDVGIVDGYYDVPWFDVGHHVDSHNPGESGNCIFNGHVVTINAGDVFRHLDELRPGDAVYVYTPTYRLDWAVTDTFSVPQEDNAFLGDTYDRRITLYTCTGFFNPLERNYDQRLVVVCELAGATARA
jgi:LPXTG-site transpeptidase (sortase) family protein